MKKLHVTCDTQSDPESVRRRALAERTRPQWCQVPIDPFQLPRLFNDGMRELPFVKDVIEAAMVKHPNSDVIVLTNADICCAPSFSERIDHAFEEYQCCVGHRREFPKLDAPLSDQEVARGVEYPGLDLFAFTTDWWLEHRDQMPDMLMGAEAWDLCLWELMKDSSETDILIMGDVIYHESHDSAWCKPENIGTLPSQLHNLKRAREFLKDKPEGLALLVPNRPA